MKQKQDKEIDEGGLDWKRWYLRFSEIHGGNPLQWRGRSLFPDGWRYSNSDYSGPELAPRYEAEARELQLVYFRLRLNAVEIECADIRRQLSTIDDDDLEQAEARLAWLEQDAAESQRRLDELLKEGADENGQPEDNDAEAVVPNL